MLPSNILAERVILSSLLSNNQEHINEIIENLIDEDFYDITNKKIVSLIFEDYSNRINIDTILLDQRLKKDNDYLKAGGIDYLENTLKKFQKPHIEDFIKLIKELSVKRLRIKIYAESQLALIDEKEDAKDIVNKNDAQLFLLNSFGNKNKLEKVSSSIDQVLKQTFLNSQKGSKFTGLRTYLYGFDLLTSGIQKTDEVVFAAESSIGKSSLATTIISNNIRYDPERVLVMFTLEMSKEQMLQRIIADLASVNALSLRTGFLKPEEWIRINFATRLVKASNLHIDDTPAIKPIEMYAKIQKLMIAGTNPDLVIGDYVQLMSPDSKKETRNLEVGSIANTIKGYAKELKTPFMLLSQLSRASNGSNGRRSIDRIRDSGVLAEAADIVGILHREEVSNKKTDDNFGKACILVEKNRNGPTGEVPLAFCRGFTRFMNVKE